MEGEGESELRIEKIGWASVLREVMTKRANESANEEDLQIGSFCVARVFCPFSALYSLRKRPPHYADHRLEKALQLFLFSYV